MGTPASKRKTADLSRYAEIYRNLKQAEEDQKKIKAYIEGLKKQLTKAIGNAEEAKIDGVTAFTYAKSNSFAWAQFANEHGDIADRYKVIVEKEVLDTDRLIKEHPTLVEPFRTRVFLVK